MIKNKDQTQIEWVRQQLKLYGKISRNTCLKNYISRLSAIITKLKDEGYEFETESPTFVTKHGWGGSDYIYVVVEFPDDILKG